jgi:hypothetical protein
MSDLPTLKSLLERVEKATGPDRELDLEIANVAGWRCDGDWLYTPSGAMAAFNDDSPPRYTASLDASLSLVNEMLPGWTRLVDATAPECGINVELFAPDDKVSRRRGRRRAPHRTKGTHNLEPHATLIAIIRALIAQKETADVHR